MKVYVICGRFGDLYMVCRQLKEPSIIACLKEFSQIVTELFPQHQVCILKNIPRNDLVAAYKIAQFKHPDKEVIICQQDGQDPVLMLEFRNYQTFQEFHASK